MTFDRIIAGQSLFISITAAEPGGIRFEDDLMLAAEQTGGEKVWLKN